MLDAFSGHQWKRTLCFFVIAGALAAGAVVVGVGDNALGLLLLNAAAVAFVLAFAHPWRTVRRFLLLAGASVAVLVAATLLHAAFGEASAAGLALFYVGVFLCPAAFGVGCIGAAFVGFTSGRERHVPPAGPAR
jgi:hypothetical protein